MGNERRWLPAAAVVFVIALAVTAVGGVAARAGSAVPTVTVALKEFALTPTTTKLAPGRVTLVAVNHGKIPHALAISGPGLKTSRTPLIPAGKSARLTVAVPGGSYTLWCPVGAHASLGMKATLRAGTASGSTQTPAPTPAPAPATTTTGGGYTY